MNPHGWIIISHSEIHPIMEQILPKIDFSLKYMIQYGTPSSTFMNKCAHTECGESKMSGH